METCAWFSSPDGSDLQKFPPTDVIDGRRQQLVGKIQERYGLAREEAERRTDESIKFMKTLPDETNSFEAARVRRVGRG
jgi:hypothetical protein